MPTVSRSRSARPEHIECAGDDKFSVFGPAKLSITDHATGMSCELQLWENASFDIAATGISYPGTAGQSLAT